MAATAVSHRSHSKNPQPHPHSTAAAYRNPRMPHHHYRRLRLSILPDLFLLGHSPRKPHSAPYPPSSHPAGPDLTALLPDDLLLRILSDLPTAHRASASLVSRRFLRLTGRLAHSLTLLDWSAHDLIPARFPNLTDLDLLPASFAAPSSPSGVLLSSSPASVLVNPRADSPVGTVPFLPLPVLSQGLEILSRGLPALRKLSLTASDSEFGSDSDSSHIAVFSNCPTLQHLELHRCTDLALRPISTFANLQILRLIGSVPGLYEGPGVTDIGLTILARGCKRLVKLELAGCEGSYDGISAIGRCCHMLEELIITDHRMEAGWLAALSFCTNLKTLKLQGCKKIDDDPGMEEYLGLCLTIERLQLQRCQLRDKRSLRALFMVCEGAREIMFENCWGLEDDMLSMACNCRGVKFLYLEGCSRLSTAGLELVISSLMDLKRLAVISCNNVKDVEVNPALASLFTTLEVLTWRPDSKSALAINLADTGIWKKGGRFFR